MRLNLVTYNIQAGIGTKNYHQYLTKITRQAFHTKAKTSTLENIANFISGFDVACVQEVDLGGRRSGFKCQVDFLLEASQHRETVSQENRVIGKVSRHGNAIFSKYTQTDIVDLKLPGRRRGRGALLSYIQAPKPFYILNLHLSLCLADQLTQVKFLIENTPSHHPLIVCGDFNATSQSSQMQYLADAIGLTILTTPKDKSYPSWRPKKDFDHILVSRHFQVEKVQVPDVRLSDHRPVRATLRL